MIGGRGSATLAAKSFEASARMAGPTAPVAAVRLPVGLLRFGHSGRATQEVAQVLPVGREVGAALNMDLVVAVRLGLVVHIVVHGSPQV